MAIDLKNVNISINEFQRLSKGDFNAGEVRLASATTLTKMNNHVHSRGKTTKRSPMSRCLSSSRPS